MAWGIEHVDTIDLIAADAAHQMVRLIIIGPDEWDGFDGELEKLQEKINTYLSYAVDGELHTSFPHLAQHRVCIQIDNSSDAGTNA